jgi:poly(beta-D-mannuronate) lyase
MRIQKECGKQRNITPLSQTHFWLFWVALLAVATMPGRRLEGAVYNVGSIADLTTRIGAALPGDQIILSNGVFSTTGIINITQSGRATQPILIAAQTIGGAEITGKSGFNLNGGDYVIIRGFHFTHTNDNLRVYPTSTHCRITQNTFDLDPVQHWVFVEGDDTEVDHNLFHNKVAAGVYVVLDGVNLDVTQRLWLHHNYFYNHHFPGSNGGESTRLGVSPFQLISAWAVVENNLYDKANGDPEAISVKSSDNVIRYNTLTNSTGSFVLRAQNRGRIEGNFILDSGGLRFYGDDNLIFNNYLQGATGGIVFGGGEVPQITDSFQTLHAAPHRARVVFNTLVNCSTYMTKDGYVPYVATDCIVANNILQGNSGTFVSSTLASGQTNFSWQTNIFWGSASTNGSPAGGYQQIDPKLATNTAVPYRIASNSPAINASFAAPIEVVTDMDGQPRNGTPDIGADEYSNAPIIHRPLTTTDVGPYVVATNFDIVAMPWAQTVMPGRGTSYTALLSTYNGFTNSVTLTAANLPVGAGAIFSLSSLSNGVGFSTLSVTTSNTTPPGRYTLLITAASAGFTNTTTACLTVGNLPANWTDVDINSPGSAGSADWFMDSFTVKGGGANISGTTDQFNFAYQPSANGLTSITVRVSTQPNTSTSAKSGVMIREATHANSKYVDVVVTPGAIKMEARTSTGGSAVNLATFAGTNSPVGTNSPCWVRLVRSGDTFTGFSSSNGMNWVQMAVTNVTMTNMLAGLAVCAGDNTKLNTSTFDNVGVQSPVIAANFTATPTNGGAPLTVTFTDTSLGTPTNRFWSFGDGATTNTTVTSLLHTYQFPGTNAVRLVVSDASRSSTNAQTNHIVATFVDTVGDGIPDWWRAQYFGGIGTTTNASSCATCDFTGTGQNNLFKYVADLNPTNPASRFAIVSIATITNDVRLIWIGGSNAWQFVEGSSNLTDTNGWSAIYTNTPPTSLTNTQLHTGVGNATNLFYRIKARR